MMKKKILLFSIFCILASIVVIQSVITANANAQWGPEHCSPFVGSHCYGLVKQEIKGTASFDHEVTQGNYIASGANYTKEFISNEMWVGFGEEAGWIETGEIAGPGVEGCCNRYRFFAEKHYKSPLYVNIDYEAGIIPLNEEVVYGIQQCGGPWCITMDGNVIHQFGGWPTQFIEREIGIEIGAENKPSSYGYALGTEGNGHQWFPPITDQMDEGICESGTEPGVCGFNRRYAYAEIDWGFGNGPHDGCNLCGIEKTKKHKRSFPIPVKKGSHVKGHMTFARDKQGRINQVWVGKRPTKQEVEAEY